jgi:hypothetical protein
VIPLIGQNQQQQISIELCVNPPQLTIWAGTIGTRVPLNLAMVKDLHNGLGQLIGILEAKERPITGDGATRAPLDVFRG